MSDNPIDTMTASAYHVRSAIVQILWPLSIVLIIGGLILGLTNIGGNCGHGFGGSPYSPSGCILGEAERFPWGLLPLLIGVALGVSAIAITSGNKLPKPSA